MATRFVHVLTIIGEAAREAEAVCEELLSRRVEQEEGAYGSDDWSEVDHVAIEALCRSLMGQADASPITYYAQYLDRWNTASERLHLLKASDGVRRLICGSQFSVVFYPARFHDEIHAEIAKARRRQHYQTYHENRWYLEHVREAMEMAKRTDSSSVVISIDHAIAPSRYDDEFHDSLTLTLGLTKAIGKQALT
jgi:hypothetical protein